MAGCGQKGGRQSTEQGRGRRERSCEERWATEFMKECPQHPDTDTGGTLSGDINGDLVRELDEPPGRG